MKKVLFISVAIILLFACNNQTKNYGYAISVEVVGNTKLSNDTLVLRNYSNEEFIEKLAVLKDGKCTFQDSLTTPEYYSISFKGEKNPFCGIFLENDEYKVTIPSDSIVGTKLEGGATQTILFNISKEQKELSKKYNLDSLVATYYTATPADQEKIKALYDTIAKAQRKIENDYLEANPTSQYALLCLSEKYVNMNPDSVLIELEKFKALPEFANNRVIKTIEKKIMIVKTLQVGNVISDFTINDTEGKAVNFKDIYSKNKVTMIDFWASWCGPCRAINPKLVNLYKKYNKKGFEIFGISLDKDKTKWLEAIKNDGLKWPQFSELNGKNNIAISVFNVEYVPQNILVDKDGIILGRELTEDQIVKLLDEKLK